MWLPYPKAVRTRLIVNSKIPQNLSVHGAWVAGGAQTNRQDRRLERLRIFVLSGTPNCVYLRVTYHFTCYMLLPLFLLFLGAPQKAYMAPERLKGHDLTDKIWAV